MFGWFKRKNCEPIRIEITIKMEPIQVKFDGLQVQSDRSEASPSKGRDSIIPECPSSDACPEAFESSISIPGNLASPAVGFGKKVDGSAS